MSCIDILTSPKKKLGFLIDPDNYTEDQLKEAVKSANTALVDVILIGGSIVSTRLDAHINFIKSHSDIPVLLFPGNLLQLSNKADGILLLSLISGRNPEFLIGNHVLAAPYIKASEMECVPTAYILINGGNVTSVEYISNTKPIPQNKHDIIVATSVAGELMGNKLTYLECGSGADVHVNPEIVKKVAENTNIPLIVGGGIRTPETAIELLKAGANMIVVGNAIEHKTSLLVEMKNRINLDL